MTLPADPFEIEIQAHKIRLSERELAKMIDHTLLRPDASKKEIEKLVLEAKEYEFYAICVNPFWNYSIFVCSNCNYICTKFDSRIHKT